VTIKFADHKVEGDRVEYKILIKDSNNQAWQVSARYSRLRDIHRDLKKKISNSQLPEFPPKTLFKNTSETFISQRKKALENYFNTLTKRYTLDQLEPLKELIKEGKSISNNKESILSPSQNLGNGQKHDASPDVKSNIQNNNALDKIVEQYSTMFYDLKDTPTFPDAEDIRSKRKIYQQFRVEVTSIAYRLPVGSENNLLSLQDDTVLEQARNISLEIESTLDKLASISLPFINNTEIVTRFDSKNK